MSRLFLAIPIPQPIIHSLAHYRDSLDIDSYTWVDPANYHITLTFFGEQPISRIDEINHIAMNVASRQHIFTLSFQETLLAPPEKTPSMLWAQYQPNAPFSGLVQTLESEFRSLFPYHDKREGHIPLPHITLARFKQPVTNTIPQIILDSVQVVYFSLMSSEQFEEKRIYHTITTYQLATI